MSDGLKDRLDAILSDAGLRGAVADSARHAVQQAYRAGLRDALRAAMRSDRSDRSDVTGPAGSTAEVVKRIDELLIKAKETFGP